MKHKYVAPTLEIEYYELNQAIANNCGTVVQNGPAIGDTPACDDYVAINPFSLLSAPSNVNFYEVNCDCYTTGADGSYWTS